MARGKRTPREYQSALDSAIFGRYEAEVFTDVWNELAGLRAEVARLTAAIARHLERAARDDHEAMRLGREDATHEWADLPEAQREAYRDAVAADFWREP